MDITPNDLKLILDRVYYECTCYPYEYKVNGECVVNELLNAIQEVRARDNDSLHLWAEMVASRFRSM